MFIYTSRTTTDGLTTMMFHKFISFLSDMPHSQYLQFTKIMRTSIPPPQSSPGFRRASKSPGGYTKTPVSESPPLNFPHRALLSVSQHLWPSQYSNFTVLLPAQHVPADLWVNMPGPLHDVHLELPNLSITPSHSRLHYGQPLAPLQQLSIAESGASSQAPATPIHFLATVNSATPLDPLLSSLWQNLIHPLSSPTPASLYSSSQTLPLGNHQSLSPAISRSRWWGCQTEVTY